MLRICRLINKYESINKNVFSVIYLIRYLLYIIHCHNISFIQFKFNILVTITGRKKYLINKRKLIVLT